MSECVVAGEKGQTGEGEEITEAGNFQVNRNKVIIVLIYSVGRMLLNCTICITEIICSVLLKYIS